MHDEFVQDNHSRSRRGVLRGMHFQPGQAKLVRCARGAIVDVVVDIRPGSPSFGELGGVPARRRGAPSALRAGRVRPRLLRDLRLADVVYKVSTYYDPAVESGFRFDDPEVGIEWPAGIEFEVSARDREAPLLSELSLGG